MLNIEEFARRMQICRATVFEWIRSEILIQGRHYLRIGRVIRFPWSVELVQRLLDDCRLIMEKEQPNLKPEIWQLKRCLKNSRTRINWDY